jgi:hypothetical protein
MRFLESLIFPGGLTLHGYCNLFIRGPIGLHVLLDSRVAFSYQSIPIAPVRHFYTCREPTSFRITWLSMNQQPARHALTVCTEKSA